MFKNVIDAKNCAITTVMLCDKIAGSMKGLVSVNVAEVPAALVVLPDKAAQRRHKIGRRLDVIGNPGCVS